MMLVGEFTRVWRQAVPARVAPKPEAIAKAFNMREMNLTPGVILGLYVPHAAIPAR
jgi:hypothetical protein